MASSRTIHFEDISSAVDMLNFLCSFDRQQSDYVYQYTNLGSIKKILESRKWKFNNPKEMNDRFEYEKFDPYWNGKYYGCFMDTDSESVAMWAMYGQPWDEGVRIGIPRDVFRRWINNIDKVMDADSNTIQIKQKNFGKVIYVTENRADGIRLGNNRVNRLFFPYDHKQEMAGYVKDLAWDYEKEIRIHVKTESFSGKAVFIPIPDEVLDKIIITMSPRFQDKEKLDELIDIVGSGKRITDSVLKSKLSWVYCDSCLKKHWEGEKPITIERSFEETSDDLEEIEEPEDPEEQRRREEEFMKLFMGDPQLPPTSPQHPQS